MDENIIKLALAKVKADRGAVGPGAYKGRAVLEIDFDIKVGEDYVQRIVGKVPWMALAAVLMNKLNGVTLEAALREALAADKDGAELVEDLNARASDAMEILVGSTETPCKGKVTGSATVVKALVPA